MKMEIGEALREARLRRGLDLYEVHRVTKISVESLRAMEEDRPTPLPAAEAEEQRAAYARFLGLDEDRLLAESGGRERDSRWRTRSVLLAIGFAAVVGVIIGLVGLGGGGGGTQVTTSAAPRATTTTTPSPPVSVRISTHALVWVCLVDQRQRPVINGLSLVRDQKVGPYDGKAFDVTFGNGKVDLTVNGEPVNVPPIAAPLGYRITPEGATRLDPADQPTCT
jgi:Helix-turn-helix domain